MTKTSTVSGIRWELQDLPDRDGTMRPHVFFFGVDDVELQSWQVPLDVYMEAYETVNQAAELAHRVVVARALIHGLPVPTEVVDSHDPFLLAARRGIEKHLHGTFPNPMCEVCTPIIES